MTKGEAPVDLICVTNDHVRRGHKVPDGDGHLTVVNERWAYCAAARGDEPHAWRETGGTRLADIRHSELDRYRKDPDADTKDPRSRA